MFSWYVFNDVRISCILKRIYKNVSEEEIREIISYIRCGIYFRIINVNENTRYTMSKC